MIVIRATPHPEANDGVGYIVEFDQLPAGLFVTKAAVAEYLLRHGFELPPDGEWDVPHLV